MKKSLFLYLFIISVLINVFTFKYFSMKNIDETKSLKETNKKLNDSILNMYNKSIDADYFSLERNDRAQNYLNKNDLPKFQEHVTQSLLAFNDNKEGNVYTGQVKMGEQKFIINHIKIVNHRWIIADYSNGQLWGEVLLKYFENEDGSIEFNVMDSYLYPQQLN